MKIIYTCPIDLNIKGGGKTHFIELAQKLEVDNDLIILVPGYFPRTKDRFKLDIKYIPLLKKNIFTYFFYELLSFFYLFFYYLKFKPDVIYCRPIYMTIFPMLIAKFFNIYFVIEENGIRDEELKMRKINPVFVFISRVVEYVNCRFANKIIAVSSGTKRQLIKRFKIYERKITVISNGANIEKFYPMNKEKIISKLKLEDNHFYVGYVGSFAPWQGLELLVEAANIVKSKGYSHINYLIIGGGGDSEKEIFIKVSKYQLEKEFIFTGRIDHNNVVYYINAFDVAVAPFIKDIFPGRIGLSALKFFEYLACGKPVIVSALEGIKQTIEEVQCGYLFKPNDPIELSKAIIQSYHDSEKLAILGKRGRKLVETQFNWGITAQKVNEVLNKLLLENKAQ